METVKALFTRACINATFSRVCGLHGDGAAATIFAHKAIFMLARGFRALAKHQALTAIRERADNIDQVTYLGHSKNGTQFKP